MDSLLALKKKKIILQVLVESFSMTSSVLES